MTVTMLPHVLAFSVALRRAKPMLAGFLHAADACSARATLGQGTHTATPRLLR